jgi:hypothetical protein
MAVIDRKRPSFADLKLVLVVVLVAGKVPRADEQSKCRILSPVAAHRRL